MKIENQQIYNEEDLFPREIAQFEKRDYGLLFYNEDNKNSYDSNHAIIFKSKIKDLTQVLKDIVLFYRSKGIKPNIYQSILEEGFFTQNKNIFLEHGFETFCEEQKFFILKEQNKIIPNPNVKVKKVSEWNDDFATEIFEKAQESWEIPVAKKILSNKNSLVFVAFFNNKPVGIVYAHVRDDVCRIDYLLVSKVYRNRGVARAIISTFVDYCVANKIKNCFLWPDGQTAEKIYIEAGFCYIETKQAARATYIK